MHALSDSRERELRARRTTAAAPPSVGRAVDPLAFTEPAGPGQTGDVSPSRLITAMAFLEGLAPSLVQRSGTGQRVLQWWVADVMPLGCVESSGELRETGHEPLTLTALDHDPAALHAMLLDARRRVVVALETALRDPAALSDVLIQLGLIRRSETGWVPSVASDRPLSDLLLALIVSDMLDRPRLYRDRFALCRKCDRISFDRALTGRRGCLDHPIRAIKRGRRAITGR